MVGYGALDVPSFLPVKCSFLLFTIAGRQKVPPPTDCAEISQAVCEVPLRFANGSSFPWAYHKKKTPREVVLNLCIIIFRDSTRDANCASWSFAGKTRPPEEFSTRLLLRIPLVRIRKKHHARWCFFLMVHLQGFEPGTH